MKIPGKYLFPALAALTTVSCYRPKTRLENYYHKFTDADEVMNDCRTALKHNSIFSEGQRGIVCEEYLTGSPYKGGFVLQKHIPCEAIVRSARAEVETLLSGDLVCFKPNINGWPDDNLGPVYVP